MFNLLPCDTIYLLINCKTNKKLSTHPLTNWRPLPFLNESHNKNIQCAELITPHFITTLLDSWTQQWKYITALKFLQIIQTHYNRKIFIFCLFIVVSINNKYDILGNILQVSLLMCHKLATEYSICVEIFVKKKMDRINIVYYKALPSAKFLKYFVIGDLIPDNMCLVTSSTWLVVI